MKNQQSFCVPVDTFRDVNLEGFVLGNGERHVLEGEAVDSEGTKYALEAVGRRGDSVCLYRAGEFPAGPDFPAERTIVRLRLRSEPPLEVGEIRWYIGERSAPRRHYRRY